ncbi:MAG: ABC transporter ATP-binding protein [Acidobacteriota bacterium]
MSEKVSPAESVIELENVTKIYGDSKAVQALREINLSIKQGERVAIMGPSGSGKSTLLHVIGGLDEPTTGILKIAGVDIAKMSDDERTRLRRERIGMIFQTFNLLPTLSALENVSLPLRLQGIARKETEPRASEMLIRVGLKERLDHRPEEMSGGERQRVAIARALIFRPALLLADEPTGNLDSNTGEEILNLLDQLHQEYGTTVLLVTHNINAARHCDRVLTLRDGLIVKQERLYKVTEGVI